MMRSLYSGVSGLKVHQTKMDVIGNNISNVNTVGFKSSSVTFTDIFYQTSQSSSGPNAATGAGGTNAKQIGLGSSLGAISTNITTQGGSQRTDNPFDLMISGESFFVVSDGTSNYFTKAGNFTVDANGTLVTSSGNSVMGWRADDEGNIIQDRVKSLQIMSETNMTTSPQATAAATAYGNINRSDDAYAVGGSGNIPLSVSFYDNLGYEYKANFNITQVDALTGEYNVRLKTVTLDSNVIFDYDTATDDVKTAIGDDVNFTLLFNMDKGDSVAEDNVQLADGSTTVSTLEGIQPGGMMKADNIATFDFNGIISSMGTIEIDFSTVTNYGSSTTIDSKRGDLEDLNGGKGVGKMSSIAIQQDGKVVASYSNGDIKTVGQIVVASFANAAGLEKVGDNLYAATLNSGEFNGIGMDVTADGGKFSTGVLEMSNVDLATEFTDMIVTQRGFQANSRIITTSDSMLEELISLKR